MWTLIYAFALSGYVNMYTMDYKFDTIQECQYYAQINLDDDIYNTFGDIDNNEYMWECL